MCAENILDVLHIYAAYFQRQLTIYCRCILISQWLQIGVA